MEANRVSGFQETVAISHPQQSVEVSASPRTTPPLDVIWLSTVSGIFIAIPCVLVLAELYKGWQAWRYRHTVITGVPCRHCHFFSNNSQLNCAVHPQTALTKEAANCADYSPKRHPHFPRQPSEK